MSPHEPARRPAATAAAGADRAAAADAQTLREFRFARRFALLACLLGGLVSLGLPALGVSAGNPVLRWAGILIGAPAEALWLCWLLPLAVRRLRWLRGMRRSAVGLRWREVRAGLIRGGPGRQRCVVMVEDGSTRRLLELQGAPWAAQLAIAYAGRIAVLGPDAAGRQAAAEPGSRAPYRVIAVSEPPPGERPAEPAPGPNGTAADQPVTAATAGLLRRTGIGVAAGAGAVLVFGLLTAITAPVSGLLCTAAGSAVAAVAWRRFRFLPELLRGLRAGPWLPVPARLDAWPDTAHRTARIDGELRLPDGRAVRVILPAAEERLVAAVLADGRLWFAGPPRPGRNTVGVPGTTMLAVADLG